MKKTENLTLSKTLSRSTKGCWLLSEESVIMDSNRSISKLLGYTSIEMAGSAAIDYMDLENTGIFLDKIFSLSPNEAGDFAINLVNAAGESFEVSVNATLLSDFTGSNTCITCVIEDMRPLKSSKKRAYRFVDIEVGV
jgi:PAS domain S-box-containing protein